MKEKLITLSHAVIIAGIIVVVTGFYFAMFKAGIPYQDPTAEMTIRWNAYYLAGTSCLQSGAITFLAGIAARICCRFI